MNRQKIASFLFAENPPASVWVNGWVRTRRDAAGFSFIEMNDGSCLKNLQVIAPVELSNYDELKHLTTGSALRVQGNVVASPGAGQKWELQARSIEILSRAPETYPLQKKRHSDEFLRTIAHLRPRTNKYGSAFRIRSDLSFAIHRFFRSRGFHLIHTPILTALDCEGAGELFRVTTFDPYSSTGPRNAESDFFGRPANLTVSGQLEAELLALALGDVYTFGPTFRAENSNTRRHAAEFWMVEPEMAFCDLEGSMDLAEELVQFLGAFVLSECTDDISLFAQYVDKGLFRTLESLTAEKYVRLPYSEAVGILEKSKQKFDFPIQYGVDLQSEHERYLTEQYFQKPVVIFDFPKSIKPFYMRVNDDGRTVAAMDVLVPKIGEIIGGSQREERLDRLQERMDEMNMSQDAYGWYLDSRRYGSVYHSGFGLGFERLLMLVTGIANIRDVIPFPRTPRNIAF